MSDQNPAPEDNNPITISPVSVPLTVQWSPRSLTMHTVTGTELDTVASLSNSVNLAFFTLCVGLAAAFGLVLSQGGITDAWKHAEYVALLAISLIGSLYFGIRAAIDHRAAKRKLNEIKCGK
jgi:hypothetical protein